MMILISVLLTDAYTLMDFYKDLRRIVLTYAKRFVPVLLKMPSNTYVLKVEK